MMRAFALSAATASDATTTNGLGSGSQSKNSRSYLKLILCCFLPNSCQHTEFHPIQTKDIDDDEIVLFNRKYNGYIKQCSKHRVTTTRKLLDSLIQIENFGLVQVIAATNA